MVNEYDRDYLASNGGVGKKKQFDPSLNRIIYWGEVISIDDEYESGNIQVRIAELDNLVDDINLPKAYPLLPKFLNINPKKGEIVRIILENPDTPQRGRMWIGSVISQLQYIEYEDLLTALSTTHLGNLKPSPSIKTYPDAKNVFPDREDVALIGRKNNDIILKENKTLIRTGKHVDGDIYKLNKINPSFIEMSFDRKNDKGDIVSENIIMADKIALISHDGIPKIRPFDIDDTLKEKIFSELSPLVRGNKLVKILELFRQFLLEHVHPYNALPPDPSGKYLDLQKLNFESILQKNIVIN